MPRYECPRHRVALVARVLMVSRPPGEGGLKRARMRRVEYFACPSADECDHCGGVGWWEGGKVLQTYCKTCDGQGVIPCNYMKPNKWQRKP